MRRPLAILIGLMAFAACGLDLAGTEETTPLPQRDGGARTDAAAVGSLPGAGATPNETPLPEAGAPTECGASSLNDNFAAGIGTHWTTYGNVSAATSNGGNQWARLIRVDDGDEAAGLFYRPTVNATAFKITFRYYAQTPNIGLFEDADYADGMTLTWLTQADPASLKAGIQGGGLGVPNGTKGYAFDLDSYRNEGIGDLDGPFFGVLAIDPAKGAPGAYDWHVAKRGPWDGVYDGWRDVVVTLAANKLSAVVDSTNIFENVPVTQGKIVAIGFTAATGGGDSVGFNIDAVSLQLTDATCP
jgi:lectin family protein